MIFQMPLPCSRSFMALRFITLVFTELVFSMTLFVKQCQGNWMMLDLCNF